MIYIYIYIHIYDIYDIYIYSIQIYYMKYYYMKKDKEMYVVCMLHICVYDRR